MEYSFLDNEWKWYPYVKSFWNKKGMIQTKYGQLIHNCRKKEGIKYGGFNKGNASYCYSCNKKVPIFIRLFIGKKIYG